MSLNIAISSVQLRWQGRRDELCAQMAEAFLWLYICFIALVHSLIMMCNLAVSF